MSAEQRDDAATTRLLRAELEALQKRVTELEGALKMAEQRFVTLKNAWDKMRKRNVPIYGSSALEGEER